MAPLQNDPCWFVPCQQLWIINVEMLLLPLAKSQVFRVDLCTRCSRYRQSNFQMNVILIIKTKDDFALGVLSIKKKSKSPRKTRIGQTPTPPPPLPIFFIFLKYLKTWKQHKKKQKKTQNPPPQKKKSELGLHSLTHFRVFLGFFICLLTWQNPLDISTICEAVYERLNTMVC